MLKKLLCMLMAMCLTFGVCPAFAEEVEEAAVPAFSYSYARALTRMGDRFLLYTDEGIIVGSDDEGWEYIGPGNMDDLYSALNEVGITSLYTIAASDDTIYLIGQNWGDEGEKYQLAKMDMDGHISLIGDLKLMEEGSSYLEIFGIAVQNGSLYISYMDDTTTEYGHNTVCKVSPEDASCTKLGVFTVTELQPYKDGKLLACCIDYDSSPTPFISEFDPESKSLTKLYDMKDYSCGGIAWDEKTDMVFYADASFLYRFVGSSQEAEICAYLPMGYGRSNTSAAVANGQYGLLDYSAEKNYYITSTDPANLPSRTLRLAIGYADEAVRSYSASHKDVAVHVTESAWDVETITQNMITGSDAADIYAVSVDSGIYTVLRDKGYCVDLSSSEKLMSAVSAMYPHLTADILQNSKLYAWPVSLNASCNVAYYPAVLEELGLDEDDLPRTWMELLDFVKRWDAEIGPDCDDEFRLFDNEYSIYQTLFGYVLQDRLLQCEAAGETMTLNTPETLNTIKRLQEMKPLLDNMSRDPSAMGGAVFFGTSGGSSLPSSLFASYYDLTPGGYRGSRSYTAKPLMLTMREDEQKAIGANIGLYVVNPNSLNKETAVEFMEYLADHMDNALQIALYPDKNDPIENTYYYENLEYYQIALQDAQTNYDNAEPEMKNLYKEQLDMMQEWMEDWEINMRWEVSPESIEEYRLYAPALVCAKTPWASGNISDLSTLFNRFLDGQLAAEQFVREFDRIVMMMEMESK